LAAATESQRHEADGLANCSKDFPLLNGAPRHPSLHYLDNAATTQKPRAVVTAINECYHEYYATVHRGLYPLAEEATRRYEQAREQIARFVGAASPRQLIFTRSTTEAINMVAYGWARTHLSPGDEVWVTRMDHHANLLPWQRVCRECDARLRVIELREDGTLDWQAAEGLFDARTRLIALCQVSNVLGINNPVGEICEKAALQDIPVLVDAAQAVAHMPVNVEALGCDFLAFSAHKMYGPSGIGALYGRSERLAEMEPLLVGGGMVDRVSLEHASWAESPWRFEAGSANLADAVGFAAAVEYLRQLGMDRIHEHVSALTRKALGALAAVPGIQLLPQADVERSGIVSFTLAGVHPHDLAQIAGERGVSLRAGHHCCQPLMDWLGIAATVRASFAIYNTEADIDALLSAIDATRQVFAPA
jgi:cysteine desulfurase/selenocysteine lyase